MRKRGIVLSVWLLGTWAAYAQIAQPPQNPFPMQPVQGQPIQGQPAARPMIQPGTGQPMGQPMPQPVQLPPAQPFNPNDPLDQILLKWEGAMTKVETLVAQLERIETDLVLKGNDRTLEGYAQYMKTGGPKPANLALLDLRTKGKKDELVEKFVCTGTYLYKYEVSLKEIRAYRLPEPAPGQVGTDSNFLSFLFGMKAQDAKRRYEMKLEKEDQHYYYIQVLPRLPQDKGDFERAQIVLLKSTFLPRMLWFQMNSSTTTWQIPAIQAGVEMNRTAFDAPRPPAGWKLTEVPSQPPAETKIIRQPGG